MAITGRARTPSRRGIQGAAKLALAAAVAVPLLAVGVVVGTAFSAPAAGAASSVPVALPNNRIYIYDNFYNLGDTSTTYSGLQSLFKDQLHYKQLQEYHDQYSSLFIKGLFPVATAGTGKDAATVPDFLAMASAGLVIIHTHGGPDGLCVQWMGRDSQAQAVDQANTYNQTYGGNYFSADAEGINDGSGTQEQCIDINQAGINSSLALTIRRSDYSSSMPVLLTGLTRTSAPTLSSVIRSVHAHI